jgi:hypothetical protein
VLLLFFFPFFFFFLVLNPSYESFVRVETCLIASSSRVVVVSRSRNLWPRLFFMIYKPQLYL